MTSGNNINATIVATIVQNANLLSSVSIAFLRYPFARLKFSTELGPLRYPVLQRKIKGLHLIV